MLKKEEKSFWLYLTASENKIGKEKKKSEHSKDENILM